jgi:hypothetical protein
MIYAVALLHYFVLFIWIGILFLIYCIYLLVCMCATIDDTQFKGPQEPSFEDVPEQQQFVNQGKWSLIIF